MKNIDFNYKNLKTDSISKFNIYDKNLLTKIESLVVFSKLSINDSNFLRDFYFLSKLFFYWFNKKISILQIIMDKKRVFNKGKSSLIFFLGCTIRKKDLIKNTNYIYNIIFNSTKSIEGTIKYKKKDSGFIYSFSNINFLLGFKSERFFNLNIKINVFFNFFQKKKKNKNNFFKKKLLNFYEKIFF